MLLEALRSEFQKVTARHWSWLDRGRSSSAHWIIVLLFTGQSARLRRGGCFVGDPAMRWILMASGVVVQRAQAL